MILVYTVEVYAAELQERINMKFEKLTRDKLENTKIMAGYATFTVKQLEDEMSNPDSEIGKRLRSVEKELERY